MKKIFFIFTIFVFSLSNFAEAKTDRSTADQIPRGVSKSTWELLKRDPKPKYARSKKTFLKKGQKKSHSKAMKDRIGGPNGEELCECGLYASTAEVEGGTLEICYHFGIHYCGNCGCW